MAFLILDLPHPFLYVSICDPLRENSPFAKILQNVVGAPKNASEKVGIQPKQF